MKFFSIPPTSALSLMDWNKNYFCLAHIALKNKEYKDFFKDRADHGFHVILDNGAAEGSLINSKDLIKLAKYIKPTELIAPDTLFDKTKTLSDLKKFKRSLPVCLNKTKLFAVPQGSTPDEWLTCYIEMLNDPAVDTIGLSKLSIPKAFCKITDSNSVSVNRRYVVKLLNELNLLTKPIHLLGMRSPSEFEAYKNMPNIRSSDSCYTVLSAVNCEDFDPNTISDTISSTPEEYFDLELTKFDSYQACVNIEKLNEAYDLNKTGGNNGKNR